ncbi:MAG: 2-C-methyl-D-erythritol 4-phosphate cytidylyltransferase [Proteobacteria bacterium]|nr:2-C-methyl-D-erythritol 4-phosphate cytidylyltransferase [Pseudomonadota bacterium]MBU1711389.1 2-C-methyl-D-erythritol 4-phosphate cytidylyltransferase [Pseudomonadota bacterium]
MSDTAAIIPAGGSGIRMGLDTPKQFFALGGIPILIHTIRVFTQSPSIGQIIVAVPEQYLQSTIDLLDKYALQDRCTVVAGGTHRQDSVRAGLKVLENNPLVAVHDAVRPLISPELIEQTIGKARVTGAAMLAIPVKDTLKKVNEQGGIIKTIDRSTLWQAQTPQVVRADLLRKAFAAADNDGFVGTDEASLLEHIGLPVTVVEGSERNIKITRPEDLLVAEALLHHEKSGNIDMHGLRIGQGFDAHRLVGGRPLILGGVNIPHSKGLLGHSDADVLVHALCDAILGAMGQGDIGRHFPDSDPQYKGADSLVLLSKVMDLAQAGNFSMINADITVIAQEPKLVPYFEDMLDNLARTCGVSRNVINIKATTTEKMGFTGRGEGIAAQAVVLLVKSCS